MINQNQSICAIRKDNAVSGFKNWCSDDDKQLALLIEAGKGWHEIGGALGRTWRACVSRARLIGVQTAGNYGKPKPWQDFEIVTLHTMWLDGAGDTAIGKALGRDAKSVSAKRRHLNMTRTPAQGLVAARGVLAESDWPRACERERKRGEALLDRALGGRPRVDARPCNSMPMPHVATHVMGQSSAAWAVAQ